MSNPGSPGMMKPESTSSIRRDSKADNGNDNEYEGISSLNLNSIKGNKETFVAAHLDPFVRLDPLEVNDGQLQGIKKKSSTGILVKSGKSGTVVGSGPPTPIGIFPDLTTIKMESSENLPAETLTGTASISIPITPSIVKPRRASVHFAVDSEMKVKTAGSGSSERSKQEGGGSRKHRSRKEKLVCRSESPSDLGMESGENKKVSSAAVPPKSMPATLVPPVSFNTPTLSSKSTEIRVNDRIIQGSLKMNPPVLPPPRATPPIVSNKVKSRVKRTSSGSTSNRASGSRKSSPNSGNSSASSLREPFVKKKKVIEIVSPRKRKMDHLDIVKTSSDPIFVRAANKPFKIKNKTQHNRFKFSRVSLNKSKGQLGGSRQQIRRTSSGSLQQQGAGTSLTKQRLVINSPVKKEPEAEPPSFPPSLINDLLWVLEDAEKEFAPDRSRSKTAATATSSSTHLSSNQSEVTPSVLESVAEKSSAARKLTFGRRRVESEPPGAVGFEMPPTPGSPSGSQAFYQVRKEVYFSPSPSYAATGPSGRRRYSRRRHARIHPPFDDTNCMFQAHHCPNSKIPGSQYCEKHLDQGPTAGYSHCKYLKDGRQCGNVFPSFDSTMTFCEQHAYQIAKAEHDLHNPKAQPDAAKNILAQINKIFTEGLSKTEVDNLDTSATSADILQIIDEPDIIEDLPLGNFTGGLLEELDAEGERNANPDKPDYDALKNAGYYTTEEIIQIHVNKLRKLKSLYQREKELEWLTRQHKLTFYKEGLEKLKQFGPRFTTNPYLISRNIDLPKEYIDHQIQQYEAAKAILQTAYKADGEKGLLRLKMLQKTQELARMAKASGQKQHDTVDICDSETDVDSDSGESRDRRDSSRYTGNKSIKCAYNEGYAIRACQNPPVCWSNYCYKHILSDPKQVQWIPCNRRIGPDPQDTCKTPCLRILQKHGCAVHAPLVMSKHKPLRRSEEELNLLVDSDIDEEEVTLEGESQVLANLVSDECINETHLDEMISRVATRGPLEITDTSDSEDTDEECGGGNLLPQEDDEDASYPEQIPS